MKRERKLIYFSVIFAVLLIGIIGFLYINSADFITPPEITLPKNEPTTDIYYKNEYTLSEIDINKQNGLDVIATLERPEKYTFTLIKNTYARNSIKTENISVIIGEEQIITVNGDKTTTISDDKVAITDGLRTEEFSLANFTYDQIVGIPNYKDISNISELFYDKNSKQIKIIDQNEQKTKEYYIDITNGLLFKYLVYQEETIVSEIYMQDILIN